MKKGLSVFLAVVIGLLACTGCFYELSVTASAVTEFDLSGLDVNAILNAALQAIKDDPLMIFQFIGMFVSSFFKYKFESFSADISNLFA